MRLFILVLIVLAGCARTVTPDTYTLRSESVKFQIIEISDLFRERGVKGSVLVFDEKNNQYYSNDYNLSRKKYIPASTFKIANTLIGLERGLLDEQTIFKWDGKEYENVSWNKDLSLREAFQNSCVPCFRELARKIGVKNMVESLDSMKYPGMKVDRENIDQFWLKGDSKISPLEQVDFLKRMNIKGFTLKPSTLEQLKAIAFVEESAKGKLYAKTGLSMTDGAVIEGGWYVGFIQKEKNRIYFATHLTPNDTETVDFNEFAKSRIDITKQTLGFLYYW
ncbi:MAG: class D beta-lactamase [Bacteroidetes bacterium]|nr:class D beta-lactamase [Bacteroidota bacterium]